MGNRYIRNFLGNAAQVAGTFNLASGERIKRITTTFAPTCKCFEVSVTPSFLTFGTSIKNVGTVIAPLLGVSDCDMVSVADINNAVAFEFNFNTIDCGDFTECLGLTQVAFEIESSGIPCPLPCEINITNSPATPIMIGVPNNITWTCQSCNGNALVSVENLTNPYSEDITACEPNGLPSVACADGSVAWTPDPLHYSDGDIVSISICCCDDENCCDSQELTMGCGDCQILFNMGAQSPYPFPLGIITPILWECPCCNSNVQLWVENSRTHNEENLINCTDEVPTPCSQKQFLFAPTMPNYQVGDILSFRLWCCVEQECLAELTGEVTAPN